MLGWDCDNLGIGPNNKCVGTSRDNNERQLQGCAK